ncbi:MAG: putative hydratase [Planctomycetota bacterium]|nr:MAG: putative hydratase [Planctomycetota bacterium]
MNQHQAQQAAEFLWQTWNEERHTDAIPESCRPATRADGYTIQRLIADISGQATVGWKIAATSEAGQKHLQVDGPLAGRLLAKRVHPDGTPIVLGKNQMRVAEAEFAFRLGRDLPPRSQPYELAEVLAAIDTLHPAIEIPDSRYLNFCIVGSPQLIADNACAHHFVLGAPTTADWRAVDLSQQVVRLQLNGAVAREGIGANVLGDPRIAMTWIANELSSQGIGLLVGQVVTTGTSVVPVPIEQGSRLLADFGCFGTVTTELV